MCLLESKWNTVSAGKTDYKDWGDVQKEEEPAAELDDRIEREEGNH